MRTRTPTTRTHAQPPKAQQRPRRPRPALTSVEGAVESELREYLGQQQRVQQVAAAQGVQKRREEPVIQGTDKTSSAARESRRGSLALCRGASPHIARPHAHARSGLAHSSGRYGGARRGLGVVALSVMEAQATSPFSLRTRASTWKWCVSCGGVRDAFVEGAFVEGGVESEGCRGSGGWHATIEAIRVERARRRNPAARAHPLAAARARRPTSMNRKTAPSTRQPIIAMHTNVLRGQGEGKRTPAGV